MGYWSSLSGAQFLHVLSACYGFEFCVILLDISPPIIFIFSKSRLLPSYQDVLARFISPTNTRAGQKALSNVQKAKSIKVDEGLVEVYRAGPIQPPKRDLCQFTTSNISLSNILEDISLILKPGTSAVFIDKTIYSYPHCGIIRDRSIVVARLPFAADAQVPQWGKLPPQDEFVRTRTRRPSAGATPGTPSNANQHTSSSSLKRKATFQEETKRRQPRRPRGDNNGGEDGDSDDDLRFPKSGADEKGKGPAKGKQFFACPFWKFEPREYHRCGSKQLQNVDNVKQHLRRAHRSVALHCDRCWSEFGSDEEALREHGSTVPQCTPSQGPDYLYQEEWELVETERGRSGEERWYQIWDQLFVGYNRPASPYLEQNGIDEFVSVFEQDCRSRHQAFVSSLQDQFPYLPPLDVEGIANATFSNIFSHPPLTPSRYRRPFDDGNPHRQPEGHEQQEGRRRHHHHHHQQQGVYYQQPQVGQQQEEHHQSAEDGHQPAVYMYRPPEEPYQLPVNPQDEYRQPEEYHQSEDYQLPPGEYPSPSIIFAPENGQVPNDPTAAEPWNHPLGDFILGTDADADFDYDFGAPPPNPNNDTGEA